MRRLEMEWTDGAWPPEIAEMILIDLFDALDGNKWARPDRVRMIREGDKVYPDGVMRDRETGVPLGSDAS